MRTNINIPTGIIHIINTYTNHINKLQECPIIIAIDGHSSCGKSTLSKDLAATIGYKHIDTGAMYRAVTYYLINNGVDINNHDLVHSKLPKINIDFRKVDSTNHTILNGTDIEAHIRGLEVAKHVSQVAAISEVRRNLVSQQRRMGESKGIVMDGRDIGSIVFPNAELKIFMTADSKIRAERRYEEMKAKGSAESYERILANLQKRDRIDSTREDSPLVQVDDAKVIDTSHLSRTDQLQKALELAIEVIS